MKNIRVKPALLVGLLLFGGATYWAARLSPSALNRQLIRAVLDETSEPQEIEALLRRGANPNLYCLPNPNLDIKEIVSAWLVGAGQPRNGEDGVPLLIRAGWSGQGEVVESLLSHGADPNLRTSSGTTALSIAKEVKRPKLIALLIQAGAKP